MICEKLSLDAGFCELKKELTRKLAGFLPNVYMDSNTEKGGAIRSLGISLRILSWPENFGWA